MGFMLFVGIEAPTNNFDILILVQNHQQKTRRALSHAGLSFLNLVGGTGFEPVTPAV